MPVQTKNMESKQDKTVPLEDTISFIEQQFPVAKLSMESFKERKANYSQTLTPLGKWWGRKPLILVRAVILGLLMPASSDPIRDREIFLSLLSMDKEGLQRRKKDKVKTDVIYEHSTPEERKLFFATDGKWKNSALIAYALLEDEERDELFSTVPTLDSDNVLEGPRKSDTNRRLRRIRKVSREAQEQLELEIFTRLPYSSQIQYCLRPEELPEDCPSVLKRANEHLNTSANTLPDLISQLGISQFGHIPSVGDAFCGAGSIPFEAARLGCDSLGSDLNPVAALLTWASLEILGGGVELSKKIDESLGHVFRSVDRKISDLGIEHNEEGWRADAYVYCVETQCPECEWTVPLAPNWIVGESSMAAAELIPNAKTKSFTIKVTQGLSKAELLAAKESGTVKNSRLICPNCGPEKSVPIDSIRQLGKGKIQNARYHESGLRLWENDDLIPMQGDVFGERLYAIRWVEEYQTTNSRGETVTKERRHFRAPTQRDLDAEKKILRTLESNFDEWQQTGIIPNREILSGQKTEEPIRTRGWTHWHHLFTPRQLLLHAFISQELLHIEDIRCRTAGLLALSKCCNFNSRLSQYRHQKGNEARTERVFYNQAFNVFYNFGCRPLSRLSDIFTPNFATEAIAGKFSAFPCDAKNIQQERDIWITDPPYADAVVYHELSEFFLAWYSRHLSEMFPAWYLDSKRVMAIKADDPLEFKKNMSTCYRNLVQHMPANGVQVVMFTHQDATVWADLTMILWAAGLKVSAAWCIATETDSVLKEGNYVQGTVLLICRKRTEEDAIFLDEISHKVEKEVRDQLDEMTKLDDSSDPNFADADYQLAAYAAALRVLTERPIEEIDPEREILRETAGESNDVEKLIRSAVRIACDHLVPSGIDRQMWKTLLPMERFYLKGLEVETHGEHRSGVYQELARGFGASDYGDLLASSRANQTRLKTAKEFARKGLSGEDSFAGSITRQTLFAIYSAARSEQIADGLNWLKTELADYWGSREKVVHILDFFGKLDRVVGMEHWQSDSETARLLAGAVRNDHV